MSDNLNKIIELKCFDKVFPNMFLKDTIYAQSIYDSLNSLVKETHEILKNKQISNSEKEAALLKETINIKAQYSQYLYLTNNISKVSEELWKSTGIIEHNFFDNIFNRLDGYFEEKKIEMSKEIKGKLTWYTGIKDVAKKSNSVINKATKGINVIVEKVSNKEIEIKEFDDSTFMENLIQKYLNKEYVQKEISSILEECISDYKEEWNIKISKQLPNFKNLKVCVLPSQEINMTYQLGAGEQAMFMGFGSAIVGTLWLATGWHTLAYAIMNVFPPIAVFSAIAGAVTGILTKDKSIEKNIKLAEETINNYYKYIIIIIEKTEFKELGNKTLRKYINNANEEIIKATLSKYESNVLGNLTVDDFTELNNAFQKHLMLLSDEVDVNNNIDV